MRTVSHEASLKERADMIKTNTFLATTLIGLAFTVGGVSVTAFAASYADLQAPRGQDSERPRAEALQAPRGEFQASRGQDSERPRGGGIERPCTETR
jgi:hypothetical protein